MKRDNIKFSLADELGLLDAQIAELKKQREVLAEKVKHEILAGDHGNRSEGQFFYYTLSASISYVVDSKRLKAEHPSIYEAYLKAVPKERLQGFAKSVGG